VAVELDPEDRVPILINYMEPSHPQCIHNQVTHLGSALWLSSSTMRIESPYLSTI
jgi:hypothetical protein